MKAKLVLTTKDRQTAQEVPFDRPSITIGRKPNNDLAFNRPEISGNHAAFLFDQNEYYVTDLGSTNGTLLNGAQLVAREKYALQDKDVITIAPYTIQFIVEAESMETMIEIPGEAIPAPKKVSSGTKPDLGGGQKKISTGTEEQMREEVLKQQQAEQAAAAAAAAQAPAPPPPKAEAPPQAQPKPVAPPALGVAPEIAAKRPSAMTDYLWLGIGALLVLAAIGLIVFIFIGL